MLKVLLFSDIHNDKAALEKVMAIDADAYFACRRSGELGSGTRQNGRGDEEGAGSAFTFCPAITNRRATSGRFASASGSSISMARRPKSVACVSRELGYSTVTPFGTPGEYGEEEIAQRLEKFAAWKPQVLVCHSPPLGTALDRIKEGLHAGSRAVREFIEKHQPAHFFCGHVHEAEGVVIQMGPTLGR